jgi:excisionase family DNA binding protein
VSGCGGTIAVAPSAPRSTVRLREVGRIRAVLDVERSSKLRYERDVYLSEPLLTASDVARLLAIPRSSVYEYARRASDPLPSIGNGRHRRFYRSHVEHWLCTLRGWNSQHFCFAAEAALPL